MSLSEKLPGEIYIDSSTRKVNSTIKTPLSNNSTMRLYRTKKRDKHLHEKYTSDSFKSTDLSGVSLECPCGASAKCSHGQCGFLNRLALLIDYSARSLLVCSEPALLFSIYRDIEMVIKRWIIIHKYSERG